MTVALYAFTCGRITLPTEFMLANRPGSMTVPVPSYLLVHKRGRAVFDSGLHLDLQRDPSSRLGELLSSVMKVHHQLDESIGARLESIDIDPTSITHIINSHLHWDHCGGNQQLPNAAVVVQQSELEAARQLGPEAAFIQEDFDTGQPFEMIDGQYDLFGDGSVVCFPTFGHTQGHQSVRVLTDCGDEVILCGDACYLKESLDTLTLPGIAADDDLSLRSLELLRSLQRGGAKVMYGHDPDFWASVPQAPNRLG